MHPLIKTRKENIRLMHMVSHDLKSQFASIISGINILEANNLNTNNREILGMMRMTCHQSIDMIHNLLELDAITLEITKEPIDLYKLLFSCIKLLRLKAGEKKQSIALSAKAITVMANKAKIWRVINNLLINAIKFSEEGMTIEVLMYKVRNFVQIEIKDHGIGIPDSIKSKVFDFYTKAKRPGTAGEDTFGLGLAICRQIVEAHEGKIWFTSKEGEGSIFYVSLPVT